MERRGAARIEERCFSPLPRAGEGRVRAIPNHPPSAFEISKKERGCNRSPFRVSPKTRAASRGPRLSSYCTVSVTSSSTNDVCSETSSVPVNLMMTVWPMYGVMLPVCTT